MTTESTLPGAAFDAWDWLRRWEAQQAGHVPQREQTFALMLDVLERLGAAPGRLLDLACGPGSLAGRVLRRFPGAEVTGVDIDPLMLMLARATLAERVRWVEADLRDADWATQLPVGQFDAVVSATALHWLDADRLAHLGTALARLLRPGGVFLNFDTLLAEPSNPRLAALTPELREEGTRDGADFEDFATWWAALEAEPGLDELFAERRRRFGARRTGSGSTVGQWYDALRAAGFAEVDTLVQVMDRRLLAAIR